MKLILVVLGLLLAGCAMKPVEIMGPDGTPHRLLSCYQVEQCYAEATEVCGGKYQIINSTNEISVSDQVLETSRTKLLIKCGEK